MKGAYLHVSVLGQISYRRPAPWKTPTVRLWYGASFYCLDLHKGSLNNYFKKILIPYMDLKHSAALNFGKPIVSDKKFRTKSFGHNLIPQLTSYVLLYVVSRVKLLGAFGDSAPLKFQVFGNIFSLLLMIFKLILIFCSNDCKNEMQILFCAPLVKNLALHCK